MVLLRHLHLLILLMILPVRLVRGEVILVPHRFRRRRQIHLHLLRVGIGEIAVGVAKAQAAHGGVEARMAIVHGGKMLKIIIEVEEFCKIVVADPGDHSVILHILRPYDILLALLCHSRGGGGCGMRPQVGCGR